MKFAYFTNWGLERAGIKIDLKETGNYSPEGLLPYMFDANLYNFQIPIRTETLKKYDWLLINNDKGLYENPAMIEQFLNLLEEKDRPKIAIIQEGPIFDWQTWTMDWQWNYLKLMKKIDLFICNNKDHINYYKEYTKNVCIYKPPIILEDVFDMRKKTISNSVMLNGNFKPWYNAHSSLKIAESQEKLIIVMQSMGQSQDNEAQYIPLLVKKQPFVKLPYLPWKEWMRLLSNAKYGINMMTAVACGTFSMNCAALGVACIGNKEFDTQRDLFPELSIASHDIKTGKELLKRLVEDEDFYNKQIKYAQKKVEEYDVDVIKKEMLKEFEKVK